MQISRRYLIGAAGAGLASAAFPLWGWRGSEAESERFEFELSDADWRKKLSPRSYAVLRQAWTEPPGSSPLNKEKRAGTYVCAGCALPLYSSRTKFNSGTGWPSFWKSLPNAVGTKKDKSVLGVRTEVHCRRCGGHLGHVFKDGPRPTGLRYCMNGAAMEFVRA